MAASTIEIRIDSSAVDLALSQLAQLAETRRELVQAFLNRIGGAAQLVRLDLDGDFAAGAGECRILFQPSDLLVEFLLASRAGECDGL